MRHSQKDLPSDCWKAGATEEICEEAAAPPIARRDMHRNGAHHRHDRYRQRRDNRYDDSAKSPSTHLAGKAVIPPLRTLFSGAVCAIATSFFMTPPLLSTKSNLYFLIVSVPNGKVNIDCAVFRRFSRFRTVWKEFVRRICAKRIEPGAQVCYNMV